MSLLSGTNLSESTGALISRKHSVKFFRIWPEISGSSSCWVAKSMWMPWLRPCVAIMFRISDISCCSIRSVLLLVCSLNITWHSSATKSIWGKRLLGYFLLYPSILLTPSFCHSFTRVLFSSRNSRSTSSVICGSLLSTSTAFVCLMPL